MYNSKGASIFSKISYTINGSKFNVGPVNVQYYNNKLPKTATEAINPAIAVHGNVYAQDATSVNENEVVIAGNLSTAEIRDTIKENVSKKLGNITPLPQELLSKVSGSSATIINEAGRTEKIYYFENNGDGITIDGLPSGLGETEDMTIINNGGPIYITSDIYEENRRNHTIVAFRTKNNADYETNKKWKHIHSTKCKKHSSRPDRWPSARHRPAWIC